MTHTMLEKAVAPDRASAPGDVRLLKRMLNRLGYYNPPDKVGITPFSDRALFDALKKFQKDHSLRENGTIKPEDDTFDALESALAQQNPNTQYIWHTVQDSKTRSMHKARDGHVFSWGNPPEGGHPGDDYNCRCWATPLSETLKNTVYDPPVERVYPEEWLLPILGVRRQTFVIAIRSVGKWIQNLKQPQSNLTIHGAERLKQRSISDKEIKKAIDTAQKSGKVITKIGKYGTPQNHYIGENGVTVIVETIGKNAGKIITSWKR